MGDSSLVIEHFQGGKVQIFEISMGRIIYGTTQSGFQWRRVRESCF
jgi:hypothetical protein